MFALTMGSGAAAAVTPLLQAGVVELNHLLRRVGAGHSGVQDARGEGQQKAPLALHQEDHLLLLSLLSTDCLLPVLLLLRGCWGQSKIDRPGFLRSRGTGMLEKDEEEAEEEKRRRKEEGGRRRRGRTRRRRRRGRQSSPTLRTAV